MTNDNVEGGRRDSANGGGWTLDSWGALAGLAATVEEGLVRGGPGQVTTGVAVCRCSHRYVVGWTVGWNVSSPWWSSFSSLVLKWPDGRGGSWKGNR